MELEVIKDKKQYQQYLNWIDKEFDKKIELNSAEGAKVQKALLLIKQYEDANYLIPLPRNKFCPLIAQKKLP